MKRDYLTKIRHVFVIDDNEYKLENLCNTAKAILPNAVVHDYTYANEFLGYLEHNDILSESSGEDCLILLDMQLPNTLFGDVVVDCGYSILARLHKYNVTCPVIIVSSDPVDTARARGWYMYYTGSINYKFREDPTEDILRLLDQSVKDRKAINKMLKCERQLQRLVKSTPIVLEYGCHTIALKPYDKASGSFSFSAVSYMDGAVHIRYH